MSLSLRCLASAWSTKLFSVAVCCLFLSPHTSFAIAQSKDEADDKHWSVVSYNIRLYTESDGKNAWPHRADTVAAIVREHDVAGLQEVLKSQLDDLERMLPDYDFVGVGRDDGKTRGEYVPIFFKKERFEKGDSGHFWLSKTPDVPGSKDWDAAITRMVSWVVLKDKQTGKEYLHLNTHFDHVGKKSRQESARIIVDKAKSLFPDLPAILTGDFNCDPSDLPYAVITQENADLWVDTLAGYKPEEGQPIGTWNAFKAIEPHRIDFIFLARGIGGISSKILDPRTPTGLFGSDHQPVQAIVKYQ